MTCTTIFPSFLLYSLLEIFLSANMVLCAPLVSELKLGLRFQVSAINWVLLTLADFSMVFRRASRFAIILMISLCASLVLLLQMLIQLHHFPKNREISCTVSIRYLFRIKYMPTITSPLLHLLQREVTIFARKLSVHFRIKRHSSFLSLAIFSQVTKAYVLLQFLFDWRLLKFPDFLSSPLPHFFLHCSSQCCDVPIFEFLPHQTLRSTSR